ASALVFGAFSKLVIASLVALSGSGFDSGFSFSSTGLVSGFGSSFFFSSITCASTTSCVTTSSSSLADSVSGGVVVVLFGVLSIGFSGCTFPEPTSLTPKLTAMPFCSGGSIYFNPKSIRHSANNRKRTIVSVMLFLLCVVSSNFIYFILV